jgi:antitoxin (DNA-binding transcriptional repressor) of toxin-antitoxin stability system
MAVRTVTATATVTATVRASVSVDLVRDNVVVARLVPTKPQATLKVGELNAFLKNLPDLGEDRQAFIDDLDAMRRGATLRESQKSRLPDAQLAVLFQWNGGVQVEERDLSEIVRLRG